MTRFMLLQNYAGPAGMEPIGNWDPADIKAHIDFQIALNTELTETGELVDAQGLSGPARGRRAGGADLGRDALAHRRHPG
jgi:hypothetical protein